VLLGADNSEMSLEATVIVTRLMTALMETLTTEQCYEAATRLRAIAEEPHTDEGTQAFYRGAAEILHEFATRPRLIRA
jgi:hypothetical protein